MSYVYFTSNLIPLQEGARASTKKKGSLFHIESLLTVEDLTTLKTFEIYKENLVEDST